MAQTTTKAAPSSFKPFILSVGMKRALNFFVEPQLGRSLTPQEQLGLTWMIYRCHDDAEGIGVANWDHYKHQFEVGAQRTAENRIYKLKDLAVEAGIATRYDFDNNRMTDKAKRFMKLTEQFMQFNFAVAAEELEKEGRPDSSADFHALNQWRKKGRPATPEGQQRTKQSTPENRESYSLKRSTPEKQELALPESGSEDSRKVGVSTPGKWESSPLTSTATTGISTPYKKKEEEREEEGRTLLEGEGPSGPFETVPAEAAVGSLEGLHLLTSKTTVKPSEGMLLLRADNQQLFVVSWIERDGQVWLEQLRHTPNGFELTKISNPFYPENGVLNLQASGCGNYTLVEPTSKWLNSVSDLELVQLIQKFNIKTKDELTAA